MAKKTESTAVNDLINLVATQGPSVKDPGADLFSEPPKKNARMTGTVPPLKGAGSVEPLPRTRAPAGTQQNASLNPAVRVSTAMPRASSIPPMAPLTQTMDGGRVRPALPPPRSSASIPRPPLPSAVSAAEPEPELEVELDDDDEADLLKTPVAAQPRAVLAPVAAVATPAVTFDPVYPRAQRTDHANAAPEMTGASPWFESSGPADRLAIPEASHSMSENTAQVQRPRNSTVELLKKLAMPMCIAIVLGIFVGGYIVFDGQGGKTRGAQSVAASTDAVANNAAGAEGTAEGAVATKTAEPATSGVPAALGAVEPANTDEPANADEPANTADDETTKVEPAKVEPTKVEPANEPAKVEPTNEPAKVAAVAPAKNDSVLGGAVDSMPVAATLPRGARPVFVDVRIDSTPAGADVSLVDRGKTTFLGTTPISASVDPSRAYDVVFSYANKRTQVEHLDPKKTTRLAVTLGKAGNQSKDAAKVAKLDAPKAKVEVPKVEAPKAEKAIAKVEPKAKVEAPKAKAEPKKVAKVADPFADDTAALEKKLAEKKEKAAMTADAPKAEKAVAGGEGVLMISSKPPCEILVNGKATGLMTPQRAMKLPAGKHKITLVSPDKAHKKTIAVEITPDKPTKVIQNLLD
ncbi:MAG: PEGA domain-containing protein [Kofleriaceae bacterium]